MADSVARVPLEGHATVEEVLRRLGIDVEREVGHIFVNGRYSPHARRMVVGSGDRIGVFPKNMGMLYV